MKEKLFICTSKDILDTLHFINNLVLRKEKDTVYITFEFLNSQNNAKTASNPEQNIWNKVMQKSQYIYSI